MFAVIETGGKQYRVAVGDKVRVEKLSLAEKEAVVFDKVLLLDDGKETMVGTPYIGQAKVEGKVLKDGRSRKIVVFKIKPKKRYRKKGGHRQSYTQVEITKISGS